MKFYAALWLCLLIVIIFALNQQSASATTVIWNEDATTQLLAATATLPPIANSSAHLHRPPQAEENKLLPLPAPPAVAQPLAVAQNRSSNTQCTNALQNGGFEEERAWGFTTGLAGYDSGQSFAGGRSMYMTLPVAAESTNHEPVAWQQLTIPTDATAITLAFHAQLHTANQNAYVGVYDPSTQQYLFSYYFYAFCSCKWYSYTFPFDAGQLAQLRGRTIEVVFYLKADGAVDQANIDDAELNICTEAATATPPPTVTPPSTATPTIPPTTPLPASPTATATATQPPATPANDDRYEPNNTCTTAQAIGVDGIHQEHKFAITNDVDWTRFAVVANVDYRIEAQIPAGSPADVVLELYDNCNSLPLLSWNQLYAAGGRIDRRATVSGTLFLRVSNVKPDVGGEQVRYQLSVRPLNNPATGALIIVAGRLKTVDPLQRNIHNVADTVYKLFQSKGYTDNDIYYLSTDGTRPGYDASATKSNLRAAITQWATGKVAADRALTLYLTDHGDIDTFYIDKLNNEQLKPSELDSWLMELENSVPGLKVNIIVETCNSGSFITGVERISKAGRVIITSTSEQNLAYASGNGAYFSDYFLTALQQGSHLYNSFWEAQTALRQVSSLQEPWLDGDGDGVVNESEDRAIAAERGFGIGSLSADDEWPPYIASVSPIVVSAQQGVIEAEVLVQPSKTINAVWAVIYPPSYMPPQNSQELTAETLDTIKLLPQGGNLFRASYGAFKETGVYRVVIHAEDNKDMAARPLVSMVSTGGRVFLPLITR